MISFRLCTFIKQGIGGMRDARKNVGRKLCEFCAFLCLLQHLFDKAIDVDPGRVEEMDAVVFFRAQ